MLREIPSYAPGAEPTVPGHEVAARIVAVGDAVTRHKVGERVLVQTDYRTLRTAGSNAAFGYNFEGGLQEYVLMDERVIIDEGGERFLLPAPDTRSASAIALVEPWSCVEDSYVSVERQGAKAGGRLLVVADAGATLSGLASLADARPASVTAVCADPAQIQALDLAGLSGATSADPATLPDEGFDDIVYFGAQKAMIEVLNDKLAARGLFNLVLGGKRVGALVNVGVGRVHYGLTRWTGTTGSNCSVSYRHIPRTGELRPGETVGVMGAGGAMGQMHVLRAISSGIAGVSVIGTDMDDNRLAGLSAKAAPLAAARKVPLTLVNPQKAKVGGPFSYIALMAPLGALVASAIQDAADGAIINIFAGIG